MRRNLMWVAVLWSVGACSAPEAPTELSDLSRYMYREWDAEDDRVRVAGMVNLDTFLAGVDLTVDKSADRSWEIETLQEDDVADVEHPDRPLDACFGLAVGFTSRWPVADHARLQIKDDQTSTEPTAEFYDRSFTNVDDPACFLDKLCVALHTSNHMKRSTLVSSVESTLLKSFHWTVFTDAGGVEHDAFYSRSWYDQSWEGDKSATTIWSSYSVDVWIDRGDGTSWRYQTLWSETELAGTSVGQGTAWALVRPGLEDTFAAGDVAIGTLFHDEPAP